MHQVSFKDKTAVVTGGGTGIGRAIAMDLAAAGAHVVVVGRRSAPLAETVAAISAAQGSAEAVSADLTQQTEIDGLASRLLDQSGAAVDILVNNAGANSSVRSTRYIDEREWQTVMDINMRAPAMLTRALLAPMVERGNGDVVMISSMAAISPGVMAGAVYSASKSAARSYMEVLAQEVRNRGVRCITIFPGEVDTAILDERALPPTAQARSQVMQPEDVSSMVLMALALPRRAMVTELAVSATATRDVSAETEAAMTKMRP